MPVLFKKNQEQQLELDLSTKCSLKGTKVEASFEFTEFMNINHLIMIKFFSETCILE